MSHSIPTPSDRPWEGERVVTLEMARGLLESQFPSLMPLSVEPIASGWDNTAFRVNQDLLFRFPRRDVAVPAMKVEIRLLPKLQGLPLRVPIPTYVGEPSQAYDWPWAGYAQLPGRPAYQVTLTEEERTRLAEPMASFVRALHTLSVDDEWDVPGDSWGRFDLNTRVPQIRSYLDKLRSQGLISTTVNFEFILESVSNLPPHTRPTLTHADLDARHWFIEGNELVGVIDWGDVHLGNPAVDLMTPWTFLHPEAREVFWETYGLATKEMKQWARFRALNQSVVTAVYGADVNDVELLRESLGALERLRIE